MRQLFIPIWQALPESLRPEPLDTVQSGARHQPDVPRAYTGWPVILKK